jgi:hypothetical protein
MTNNDRVKFMASMVASGLLAQVNKRQSSEHDLTYDEIVEDSVTVAMKIDSRVDAEYDEHPKAHGAR